MAIVQRLGFITIGAKDLDEAAGLYSKVGRMVETGRDGSTAFLTGGTDHHWMRIEQSDIEEVKRVGYDVGNAKNMADAIQLLKDWKLAYEEVALPNGEYVQHRVRFTDPGGMSVDLFYGMDQLAKAPDNDGINIKKFLHAGWRSPNFDETFKFWTEGLGFKVSDQIEQNAFFMRCDDRYHHSLLLIRTNALTPEFGHICTLVDGIDDVMRIRNNGLKAGAKLRSDVMKHVPSGSVAVYFTDEKRKFDFEYCFEHAQLPDDHQHRVLPMKEAVGDVWQAEVRDPELTSA
ncbi:MAG: VOC family protein [Hyphomonadaceae bacterium]|nr:VOC family protein [Hyphomonadaceae bacterium]